MYLRSVIYLLITSLLYTQGLDFPDEPIQAPITYIWPLVLIGGLFFLRRSRQNK